MERLRQMLAQEPDGGYKKPIPSYTKPISKQSAASTSSESASVISISSDVSTEVEEILAPTIKPAPLQSKPASMNMPPKRPEETVYQKAKPVVGNPIHIPSNRDIPRPMHAAPPKHTGEVMWETFQVPVDNIFEVSKTAEETEKDLKDLLQGTFNGREEGEADKEEEEIDMTEAIVKGFRDGITLLPHQIIGKKWMKERETGKKYGGILADDMGLGKTIQTLTRIVDRPRRDDLKDGEAPTTLVVCPLAVSRQWASEIKKMTTGATVVEHLGPTRTSDPRPLSRAHVVITTYQTLSSEYAAYEGSSGDASSKKASKKKAVDEDELDSDSDDNSSRKKKPARAKAKKCALFEVFWHRIVLDEAHTIKNRNTKTAQACCALQGTYRWCLTGTPLQNNVEELYSLLKFLRIRPLNDWTIFNEQINKPVKSGKSTRAMKRLHVVLKAIMLRRQKLDTLNGKPLIELPPKQIQVVHCEFDKDEKEFYLALEGKIEEAVNKFMASGDVSRKYTAALVLLLRLRQACNHPSLVTKKFTAEQEALDPKPAKKDDDDEEDELANALGAMSVRKECQLCCVELTPSNTMNDDAEYCKDCVEIARRARRQSQAVQSKQSNKNLPPSSAKTRKIVELLEEILRRERVNIEGEDQLPREKTIVFSQFTSMLDIIQVFLDDAGIRYVRYDGSMSKDARDVVLEKIKTSKTVNVILISFKAGSVGLNLTACNNVILVDLWWNPALEDQAFDRAHRFGQNRPVNIYKLTIEKTVEERILTLQNEKRLLAAAALSGDKIKKSAKLGMDDLMRLFRPGAHDDDDEED